MNSPHSTKWLSTQLVRGEANCGRKGPACEFHFAPIICADRRQAIDATRRRRTSARNRVIDAHACRCKSVMLLYVGMSVCSAMHCRERRSPANLCMLTPYASFHACLRHATPCVTARQLAQRCGLYSALLASLRTACARRSVLQSP